MSGSSCEEGYHALLQTLYRCILGKHLCHGSHGKRSKYLRLHADTAENLGHVNAVHNRCQHSDLVRFGTVNVLAGSSAPEVTASDHYAYLHAAVADFLYLFCHLYAGRLVKTGVLLACESLTAQFQ